MNALWVLAIIVGVVSADVSHGYHYKVPQTSYGVPSYQVSSSSNTDGISSSSGIGSIGGTYHADLSGIGSTVDYSNLYAGNSGLGTGYYAGVGNTGYLNGFQTGSSGLDNGFYQTGAIVQPTYQTGVDYSTFNQYQTSDQYQTAALEKYQQYYDIIHQQPAQVFKHFYVHEAPEEPEVPKQRKPIILPPAQKHYKVIFIKAPNQQIQTPQIIPVQQPNEEKTIVYVLVKKPEEAQNIVIPQIDQKAPSKPEVYFIKYNNKQDSQAVINNIVSDLNKGASLGSGYSGAIDGAGIFTTSNLGPESLVSSTVPLGSGSFGTGTFGSGSSTFGSGSSGSSTFGSDSSSFGSGSKGSGTFSSGSSSFGSEFSTSAPSVSFGSSSGSAGSSFGSSLGIFGSSKGSTTGGFGSPYDTAKGVNVVSVDNAVTDGYDNLSGSTVASSTASTLSGSGYDSSVISTSQGIPHETYGPPTFKVL